MPSLDTNGCERRCVRWRFSRPACGFADRASQLSRSAKPQAGHSVGRAHPAYDILSIRSTFRDFTRWVGGTKSTTSPKVCSVSSPCGLNGQSRDRDRQPLDFSVRLLYQLSYLPAVFGSQTHGLKIQASTNRAEDFRPDGGICKMQKWGGFSWIYATQARHHTILQRSSLAFGSRAKKRRPARICQLKNQCPQHQR